MRSIIRVGLTTIGGLIVLLSLYLVPTPTSRIGIFVLSIVGFIIALIGIVYPKKLEEFTEDTQKESIS